MLPLPTRWYVGNPLNIVNESIIDKLTARLHIATHTQIDEMFREPVSKAEEKHFNRWIISPTNVVDEFRNFCGPKTLSHNFGHRGYYYTALEIGVLGFRETLEVYQREYDIKSLG